MHAYFVILLFATSAFSASEAWLGMGRGCGDYLRMYEYCIDAVCTLLTVSYSHHVLHRLLPFCTGPYPSVVIVLRHRPLSPLYYLLSLSFSSPFALCHTLLYAIVFSPHLCLQVNECNCT